ncbi:MAG: MarR family transcriptional regulator [Betaproteobacteria bacterium]
MPKKNSNLIDDLYCRPGFLIRRMHQLFVGIFEDECKNLNLSPPQYSVLKVLSLSPGQDQSSLARMVGLDKVTTFHIIRNLEKRKLISRVKLPDNKKRFSIILTKSGIVMLKKAQSPVNRAYSRIMAPMTVAQGKQFLKLLDLLTASLEIDARAPLEIPSRK